MSETSPSPGSRFRKLRIAFSAVCGILCLLLIVLWVRSKEHAEILQGVIGTVRLQFRSEDGRVDAMVFPNALSANFPRTDWVYDKNDLWVDAALGQRWRFGKTPPSYYEVAMPHWFPVVLVGVCAAVPWIRWHFSVRTLVVAMTVIAALLGTVVWATS